MRFFFHRNTIAGKPPYIIGGFTLELWPYQRRFTYTDGTWLDYRFSLVMGSDHFCLWVGNFEYIVCAWQNLLMDDFRDRYSKGFKYFSDKSDNFNQN